MPEIDALAILAGCMSNNTTLPPQASSSEPETDDIKSLDEVLTPAAPKPKAPAQVREIGGPAGPEPTRYGDWERKGRCIDF